MKIATVSGTVVSTINAPLFDQQRLLVCDIHDAAGERGEYVIAVDTVGAGAGETVLVIDEGNSARQVLGVSQGPIRAVIVGIIDELIVDDVVREVT